MGDHDDKLRVDKWLWAARFYKTRSMAADAVDTGKVLVNGARVKPAKPLRLDDELSIRVPGAEYTVRVRLLSDRRGPASVALTLYIETEDSRRRREEAKLTRVAREPSALLRGRPTKRTRRQLDRFRHGED